MYIYIGFGNRIVPFFSFLHMKKKENKLLQASIDNIGSYRSAICPTTVIMYGMVPMYTVHASVRFCLVLLLITYYCAYGQTCAYCTVGTTRGICTCTLYAVRCTWYGYTYDEDDDHHDMTRCRIHRDAALREAKEREKREGGWEGGKIGMAGTRVVRP